MQIKIIFLLLSVWLTGFIVCLARLLCRYKRAAKSICAYGLCEDERYTKIWQQIMTIPDTAKISGRKFKAVEIRSDDRALVPMGFGIFRRTVVLPNEAYSDAELYYILLHEYTHFQNHDIARKLGMQIVCCIFWWVPFVYPMRRGAEQAVEIKCDLDATEGMEAEQRAAYLAAIVTVLKKAAAKSRMAESGDRNSLFFSMKEEAEIIERFRAVSDDTLFRKKGFRYTKIRLYLFRKRTECMVENAKAAIKTSVTLKTLLRSPIRTVLTFALIAAASFALFSRVTDYAITTREMKRAESYYHGVASLDTSIPDYLAILYSTGRYMRSVFDEGGYKDWPQEEQLQRFSSLPGVTLADRRYMTAGFIGDYQRINKEADMIAPFFIMEGTYAGYEDSPNELEGDIPIDLKFEDVKILASEADLNIGSTVILHDTFLGDSKFAGSPLYTRAFFDGLEKGSRCLVYGQAISYSEEYDESYLSFWAKKGENAFYVLNGEETDDPKKEMPSVWKDMIDGLNQDRYAYEFVYTSDTRAIPCFNEREITISNGRHLMNGDTDVCVVDEKLLEYYGLEIGDKVHVKIGDRLCSQDRYSWSRGTRSYQFEKPCDIAAEAELEIVGAYHMNYYPGQASPGDWEWKFNRNTVFVPSSLLPVGILKDMETHPKEYSIFIENARDIERFREAAQDAAVELDLRLRFSDGGWKSVKDNFEMGRVTSLLTMAAFATGAVTALLLAVYLYIGRNKKSYAILRMLGLPGKIAGHSLVLPFMALAVLAIPAGGFGGLYYARYTAQKTLVDMMSGSFSDYAVDVRLPVNIVVLCLLAELVFMIAVTFFFLYRMQKTPPLELLQEGTVRLKMRRGKKTLKGLTDFSSVSPVYTGSDMAKIPVGSLQSDRKYGALQHVSSYVFRHIRRHIGRTTISLLLTVVLTVGIGMFILTGAVYRESFINLDVRGKALDFASDSAGRLMDSPLVKNFYCYGEIPVLFPETEEGRQLIITNDPDKHLGNEVTYSFEEGCDLSVLSGTEPVCLMGKELAKERGVKAGDVIQIIPSRKIYAIKKESDTGEKALSAAYKEYRVVGIMTAKEDVRVNYGILTGLKCGTEELFGQPFSVTYSEFSLADNEKCSDLEELLQNELLRSTDYSPSPFFHLDSEALRNIDRIRNLLDSLFPIAVAAAVMIGLTGSLLMILQSSLEAVLLRALGVTKRRARCMLVSEQILLCAFGILFVTGGIALSRPAMFLQSAGVFAGCFGLYFWGCVCGAAAAAIQLTKNRILELLQVKE